MESTAARVKEFTAQGVNARLQSMAEARIAYCAEHPEAIGERLRALDEEWDLERAIEAEAASTVLTGFFFAAILGRKWLALSVVASGALLLHSLHGAYPLLPFFRRAGLRTAREIAAERYALKALRGDFDRVQPESFGLPRVQAAFEAARH